MKHSKRCPKCNQFASDYHVCPMDDDWKTNPSAIGQTTWTENDDGAVLDIRTKRIMTLEDLLEAAKVDMTKWYVERTVINKWEVGAKNAEGEIVVEPLWQVKAWLKPITPLGDVSEIIQQQVEDMKKHSPPDHTEHVKGWETGIQRYMYEINISDLHFGMYAWGEEAGENYDLKISKKLFLRSIMELAHRSMLFPVERILLPIGNDLLHVDVPIGGKGGATTKGTPMDVDTRYKKMFREARIMIVEAIEYLKKIAPVNVLIVPGNHDSERIFCLGDSLEAWFHNDDRVHVLNDPTSRKYVWYGKTLIGYCHGNEEKVANLPQLMADEEATAWAGSVWREWHIGHVHAKRERVTEIGAVRIVTVPSIAPNDEWHTRKGYHHVRAAEGYMYGAEDGYVATFSTYAK